MLPAVPTNPLACVHIVPDKYLEIFQKGVCVHDCMPDPLLKVEQYNNYCHLFFI